MSRGFFFAQGSAESHVFSRNGDLEDGFVSLVGSHVHRKKKLDSLSPHGLGLHRCFMGVWNHHH